MVGWLLYRLGGVVLAAWGIASLVFLLSHLSGVQPEEQAFARLEALGRFNSAESLASSRQAMRQRLGLTEPVFYATRTAGPPVRWHWHGTHNQYHTWLRQLLRGQLGRSYRDGQPVAARIWEALAVTLPLLALALLLSVGLALLLGLYVAAGPGWGRRAVRLGLLVLQALPLFALSLGLLLLLANPDMLNLLPADDLDAALPSLGSAAARLALPLLSLVLASLPELTLPLAAALRHELTQPYATAARAKGLSVRQVLWRHALPNAVLPFVVLFTGLLPALVAGAVVVEVLFTLPGMGRLLAEAAAAQDVPVLTAGVLLAAAARLLALLLTDTVQLALDPRLRAKLA